MEEESLAAGGDCPPGARDLIKEGVKKRRKQYRLRGKLTHLNLQSSKTTWKCEQMGCAFNRRQKGTGRYSGRGPKMAGRLKGNDLGGKTFSICSPMELVEHPQDWPKFSQATRIPIENTNEALMDKHPWMHPQDWPKFPEEIYGSVSVKSFTNAQNMALNGITQGQQQNLMVSGNAFVNMNVGNMRERTLGEEHNHNIFQNWSDLSEDVGTSAENSKVMPLMAEYVPPVSPWELPKNSPNFPKAPAGSTKERVPVILEYVMSKPQDELSETVGATNSTDVESIREEEREHGAARSIRICRLADVDKMSNEQVHSTKLSGSSKEKLKERLKEGQGFHMAKRAVIKENFITRVLRRGKNSEVSEKSLDRNTSTGEQKFNTREKTKSQSLIGALKPLQIAVVSEGFPGVQLAKGKLQMVRSSILEEYDIIQEDGPQVRFENCFSRPGFLVVTCADDTSAQWLRSVVPKLRPWEDASLLTLEGEAILKQ